MRNWLKWVFAGKEMELLERYRTTLEENRRFFSITTDISLVLENININVEGGDWETGNLIPCSTPELRNRILSLRNDELVENTKRIQTDLIKQLKGSTDTEEKQLPLFNVSNKVKSSLPLFTHEPYTLTSEGPITITVAKDKEYLLILENGRTYNIKDLVDISSITHEEVVRYFENGITDSAVGTVMTFLKKYFAAHRKTN